MRHLLKALGIALANAVVVGAFWAPFRVLLFTATCAAFSTGCTKRQWRDFWDESDTSAPNHDLITGNTNSSPAEPNGNLFAPQRVRDASVVDVVLSDGGD